MVASTVTTTVRGEYHKAQRTLAALHTVGLFAGAALAVTLLSALSAAADLPERAGAIVLGVACLGYGLATLAGRSIWFPSSRAQVPESWRESMNPREVLFFYGVGLGVGFATRVRSFSLFGMAGAILVLNDLLLALAIAAAYALARGLHLVLAVERRRDPGQFLESVDRTGRRAVRLDAATMVAVGLLLVAAP